MKLYVIRHGQTNMNVQGRINSLNNEDLTEEGERQAKALSRSFYDIDYDFIISSPLIRAQHTAKIINVKNKQIILDERIQERDAGKLVGLLVSEIDSCDWWSLNPKTNYKDAEKVDHLIERVGLFLDEIRGKYKNKKVVLVTHGGVCKAIRCYFEGVPSSNSISEYKHDNCSVCEYDV
jgi:probable phosphoglycerate mutase